MQQLRGRHRLRLNEARSLLRTNAVTSIVVLAERYEADRVLTLDQWHFRALRTISGEPLVLLPADC